MRISLKLVPLCALALTALALGASSASAQETSIELTDEIHGTHCNPCYVHFTGATSIFLGAMNVSYCDDEWEAEIYENGSGHVYQYASQASGGTLPCTRRNCNGVGEPAAETEWPVTNPGEAEPDMAHATVRTCLDSIANPNGTGLHCNLEVKFQSFLSDPHTYAASTHQLCGPFEVIGLWESEEFGCMCGHDIIEIIHQ